MPAFSKLTPNLLVLDVSRSLAFYTGELGFARGVTVPDAPPFAFASVVAGGLEIFFNEAEGAVKEYPILGGRPIGLSGTLFVEVQRVDDLYERLRARATVVLPIHTQWYGMREFAIADPDGYVLTFAERVSDSR